MYYECIMGVLREFLHRTGREWEANGKRMGIE